MIIRQKSKEELTNQVEEFFNHKKKLWKITEDKANEIMEIFSQYEGPMDKDSMKDNLSWKISPEEFDKLYWEYENYQKSNFIEMRNYTKEIGIFPEEAEPFINWLVKLIIKENGSVENVRWMNTSDEEIKEAKEFLRWNILALKRAIWSNKKLSPKLLNIVASWEKKYIEVFSNLWIKSTEDFLKLEKIICEAGRDSTIDKIQTFGQLWIETADDFIKLKDIICNSNAGKDIIEIFGQVWIKTADDFIELKDIICGRDTETTNIKLLSSMWITSIKDFLRLSNLCTSQYTVQRFHELEYSKILPNDEYILDILDIINKNPEKNIFELLVELADKVPNIINNDLINLNDIYHKYWVEYPHLEEIILLLSYKWFLLEQISKLLDNLRYFLWKINPENFRIIFEKYPKITPDELCLMENDNTHILSESNPENLKIIFEKYSKITPDELCLLENDNTHILSESNQKNLGMLFNKYEIDLQTIINSKEFKDILENGNPENIETILSCYENITIDEFLKLSGLFRDANTNNLKIVFKYFKPSHIDVLDNYEKLLFNQFNLPQNLDFNEDDHKWYSKYLQEVIDFNISDRDKYNLISDIVKLSFDEIYSYLREFKVNCINHNISYSDFVKCFVWKTFNQNLFYFLSKWFEIPWSEINDNVWILNHSIKKIYPKLDIEFNERETKQILNFIDSIWWINKWYSILILTMEKMVRDWLNKKNFNNILLDKLEKYRKVFDMYPENKIPNWLKVSIGMEFEMTKRYLAWYKEATWNDYKDNVNNIVKNAKIGIEHEWVYEFATKPSINPMVALLEIHLLQELNLLDINDMLKLSWNANNVNYSSRNGTGYHLNIWSDSDIWVDENVQFIQNLCTILPRAWISNGGGVWSINHYSNVNSKSSNFFVFPDSKSTKYIELRTYSVDDVELFEKNVLFNSYAIMWNQAQKKVSNINHSQVMELADNIAIKNPESLMKYLENNNLFKENQDLKSKKIAAEFIWMQISVLRTISNYNHNFINDELFWKDLLDNLSEPWKNYFLDLLLSDKKESIWFVDAWYSSMVVKKYTNLKDKFDVKKYIHNYEPFTSEETREILGELWNTVDEKWIPFINTWINKQLLRAKLCNWSTDTQELQDNINTKMSNIDRIKSYLRWNDQNLKIDRDYLYKYFKEKMSLIQFNPYHAINLDYVNRIINLNNFFLKKDDANANGVLQSTKYNWEDEDDISKLSIFETWYMRKWYNYYQWWSEDMLIHSAQRIALDYIDKVKNILDTDYENEAKRGILAKAA